MRSFWRFLLFLLLWTASCWLAVGAVVLALLGLAGYVGSRWLVARRLDVRFDHLPDGTNYWGIPFRIGTPPEVTVIALRAMV